MVGVAMSSILVGVFDVKHYFHLQLVPHISRHYQYWRLGVHHLAFSSSSELFIAEILLYNIGIQIERQFGTLKFASFAIITTLLATLVEFISLIFILYQYHRIVPSAYSFRIFGLPLTNKSFTYIFALQLAIGHLPGSAAVALIGVFAGQIYRSDLANFKGYRIPPWLASFSSKYILPLLGSLRPARRSNRALPDEGDSDSAGTTRLQNENDEVITTARRTPAPSTTATQRNRAENNNQAGGTGTGGSVVREWVEGLTGRSQTSGIRIPTEAEIAQLSTMFPDLQRDVLVGTLQRSPNIESAVETLLSSQR
ncbi:DSC E3 ubiquitin ligase complex subunit 2 [Mycena venus]|uniref:DSC E3 ubiquitin ligase complex subunit 2 n=1 Tax=Mycena venus TaxID=2733690 RepID=A0A8H6Y1F5_9AGAR|nr:DSC E3 ubiquitin ligase complex subunit 2 [Mycena venus]